MLDNIFNGRSDFQVPIVLGAKEFGILAGLWAYGYDGWERMVWLLAEELAHGVMEAQAEDGGEEVD